MTTDVSAGLQAGSRRLVDQSSDVGCEAAPVDVVASSHKLAECFARKECASRWEGTQFGDRLTVSGDDETLAGLHSLHDLCVVVAQLTLGDGSSHRPSVALRATFRYAVVSAQQFRG